MRSVLRIIDGGRKYTYLLDWDDGKLRLYYPDWRPEVYGRSFDYQLNIYRWIPQGSVLVYSCDFTDGDALACPRFRYEENMYNQYIEFPWTPSAGNYYVSLHPMKNGQVSINYTGAQGAFLGDERLLRADIQGFNNNKQLVVNLTKNFEDFARNCFEGDNGGNLTMEAEFAIIDEDNIYYRDIIAFNSDVVLFDLTKIPFKSNNDYIEGLKIVAIVHLLFEGDQGELNLDIRSAAFPLTPQIFAEMISASQNTHIIDIPKNMNINELRIVSKTEQKIVNMTAETDSKANIIQPVFFRVRELAQIIVHPAVTENICINLDAYKSQCERFYIKIEGTSFAEIGRTESGIIFKIQGNLLPGALSAGTYYVLNENAELVTTGRYIYEV